ncbi:PepSY-associated TM helix domain-containing protein [Pseudoalteromonas luteoviolacea]|uniref:Peptidase n=1 Tax=Pseudoalteromonas luteoviolacea S4054 TaxID=1129367 RepID=A0A0F6AHE0_9GAMM|nr:PepSY-associated TM helix domain-containing protein [Pseudoalteromonas luteoviolacea]AOT06426.1 hypothetical protein S4054249_00315 [Pseudoalteromonas luteoviolacea]AOT11343.1 hypothetical protein S40542_00315 [Pseudoalteromonas luteoviolacea]AOT16256.1 hypothetical protein S4054_00315 [Pseudoalteromonas luteoviolacea]KKE85568.1 hypothetical protein N479_04520 [Pseudoalteromonas luteoviolacea S4054]KZN73026.1 hypothetical protein N481_13310 [Pseudoalteromonas luteoviolacea S4047-1]
MSWFKLNRSLHRDIGYFCIGMTLVFAISGIALNHIHQFNSNYQVTRTSHTITLSGLDIETDHFEATLLATLQLEDKVKARFWQDQTTYKLFLEEDTTLYLYPEQNEVLVEQVEPRFLLRQLNFLHLNEARAAWMWFSDFYAILLIYLAVSALFMVKGKRGVLGPRGLLVLAGFAAPAAFIIFYSH